MSIHPTENNEQQIILIEGMSGTGKSILAQQIWFQYKNNDLCAEWFHEEETEHPVFRNSYYRFLESGSASDFSKSITANWKEFLNKKNIADVNIFEAQFLLSYIAGQLWYNVSEQEIIKSIDPVIDLLLNKNCTLIYYHTDHVENIISNTIHSRGSEWKNNHFKEFNESKFAIENDLKDMDGLISFWNAAYRIGDYFFDRMKCKKVKIDITTLNWNASTLTAEQFLGFNNPLPVQKMNKNLCGTYVNGNDKKTIEIFFEENRLFCHYGWPRLELLPKNQNEFYIKGFPHQLRFSENDEKTVKIEITGKDIAGQIGRVYIKNENSS